MSRRLLKSILIAVTLAIGVQGQIAAAPPFSMMCESDLVGPAAFQIPVSQFGSIRAAVHQCLFHWNGKVSGIDKDGV